MKEPWILFAFEWIDSRAQNTTKDESRRLADRRADLRRQNRDNGQFGQCAAMLMVVPIIFDDRITCNFAVIP
jgi:hypothetical protein